MPHPRTIGLVLAGGRSTRMHGQDKAFRPLAGRPLLAHVIERLAPQVDALAINSNAPAEQFTAFGLPVLADVITDFQGPLAGIHAGLAHWPEDFLVTVAVDLPFLPRDLVARLRAGLGTACCVYASHDGQHALALLWAPGMAGEIATFLERGERSLKAFLADHGQNVPFPPTADSDLFFNVNTPNELAAAEARFTRHG